MIRWLAIAGVGLALGCEPTVPEDPNGEPVPAVPAVPAPVPDPVPVPEAVPGDAAPAPDPVPTSLEPQPVHEAPIDPGSPAGVYAQCVDRVELPEQDGECKSDADCGSGGCSGEMCVARSLGAITSTCEVRACFGVLDTCGCVEGKCQWSLKAAAPPRRTMPPLDVQ